MYAIIKTGGKQVKVEVGQAIYVEKLDVEAGEKVVFDEVILVGGESTKVGAPTVAGATVEGTVEKHGKQKKVVTFKFTLTGHADAGPYGSDIVCAGVSALAISTVNGIASLAGFEPIVEMNEEEGGYLYTEVTSGMTQEQNNIAEILLENLLLGLQSIEAENSEYIQIKTINDK